MRRRSPVKKADSIAFATHDLGAGQFHLVGWVHGKPWQLWLGNTELQGFWVSVGDLLTANGRIDILSCDLAGTQEGGLLISQMENLTGHQVAASDDATGNPSYGADWVLETDNVDLVATYFVRAASGCF